MRESFHIGEGSNAWTIGGPYTDNGRPMLVNDSHASLRRPSSMVAQHLSSVDGGGTFDAMGLAFVGVPGIQVGQNDKIAWGATTHFATS